MPPASPALTAKVLCHKSAEYGRIITPEEAKRSIQKIAQHTRYGTELLQTYGKFVSPETCIGIEHIEPLDGKGGYLEYFLIGKSRDFREDGGRYEMTLRTLFFFLPSMKVGINYDGNDAELTPRRPEEIQPLRRPFWRWGQKPNIEEANAMVREKFPLCERKYGAVIESHDSGFPSLGITWYVRDERLRDFFDRFMCDTLPWYKQS